MDIQRTYRLLAAFAAVATLQLAQAEIVIGQVAPLSGVLATTGHSMVVGAKVAFAEANARGGIHGVHIKHIVKDDGYKIPETIRLTQEAIEQDQAIALFGFAGTSNVGELLKQGVLEKGGIALVAPYTGGEPLRKPYNPFIFHVRAGYADEAEHMVQQLHTLGITRIGVFYQDDGFGKAGLLGVEEALTRRGLKSAASAPYERNTDKVETAVKTMIAAQPQAVIMISVNRSTAAFVKAYRNAGGGGQLFNISVVDPGELVKLGGQKEMHGVGISQVVPFPYSPSLPVIREYQALMKKHAPTEPFNYTSFEEFIGAKILLEALKRAGPKPTRAKVIAALETLRQYDVGGFTIDFGPQKRIGSQFVEVTVIGRDGRLRR